MAFLEDLRAYLERPELQRPAFNPDRPAHRQHLLESLQQLENKGEAASRIQSLHAYWSEHLDQFAEEVGATLVDGPAHGASRDELTRMIDIALSRALQLDASTGSRTMDLELDRLSKRARRKTAVTPGQAAAWEEIAGYALEIRAIRRSGGQQALTLLGRLILELPNRDALRWMLAVEAVQSRGQPHPSLLSPEAARKLLEAPKGSCSWQDERCVWRQDQRLPWVVTRNLLRRLSQMGLVWLLDDEDLGRTDYEMLPIGHELLEEIASGEPTPFSVLAEALLQDETTAVLGQLRPAAALVQREGAAAATTRHARMVAHEIRNALVPVQAALGSLYRDVERQVDVTLLERHRGSIDGGIARVFQFIKEMVEVAARGGEPAEPFEVTPAIEGAVAAVVPELALQVSLALPPGLPPVVGHRSRFTLAIVNLLRNAGQARDHGSASARIAAEISPTGDAITVTVDDDGPGVPSGMREAIFRPGFSLRPGGSGEGLALVREVVEGELGGRATCEDGPSGGARFVLRIPVRGGGAGR